MTVFKYDLTGVGPNIQFGKSGGKINWVTDHFEMTNAAGALVNQRVATTPVNANDAASKVYVDTTIRPTVAVFYPTQPPASRFIMIYKFDRAISFPDNFVGSQGSVVSNPTSSYVMTISKNLITIGTITINTSGVFTFVTSGTGPETFAVGDRIGIAAPASTDLTISDISVTLRSGT